MIHPEYTTVQRRSRPPGHTGTIHQGSHADSCQIDFHTFQASDRPRCSPTGNPSFIHRSHTAVLYFSDYSHSTGGELFMTDDYSRNDPPMEHRDVIPLKCGRLVAFESSPQNLHGVNSFETGSRWAIDL